MSEPQKDTTRALAACKAIVDARDPHRDYGAILVTAEHAITALLLTLYNGDPRKAAAMLNEGLVPGVEERLSFYASKTGGDHE